MLKISPSMLSCDFSKLGEETKNITEAGADMLHLDVMDGIFVPNITFGAPVIKAIRKYSDKIFDVHLMIENPLDYISDFSEAGADIITFHYECKSDTEETIKRIKAHGKKAGLSIKPATDAEEIFPYLDMADMILVMSVEPGFGGQKFMESSIDKIKKLSDEIKNRKLETDIEVDGGINNKNIRLVSDAGAEIIVAGSAVFNAEDRKEAIVSLRSLAEK